VNVAGMKVNTPLADCKVILEILEDDYRDPEIIYPFYDEAPTQTHQTEVIRVAAFNATDDCVEHRKGEKTEISRSTTVGILVCNQVVLSVRK